MPISTPLTPPQPHSNPTPTHSLLAPLSSRSPRSPRSPCSPCSSRSSLTLSLLPRCRRSRSPTSWATRSPSASSSSSTTPCSFGCPSSSPSISTPNRCGTPQWIHHAICIHRIHHAQHAPNASRTHGAPPHYVCTHYTVATHAHYRSTHYGVTRALATHPLWRCPHPLWRCPHPPGQRHLVSLLGGHDAGRRHRRCRL